MTKQHTKEEVEWEKLQLEKVKFRYDIVKWVIIGIAAVCSFYIIDFGRYKIEKFRVFAQNERELLSEYLKATESPTPRIWERKLYAIVNYSNENRVKKWALAELQFNRNCSAKSTLYQETRNVAASLLYNQNLNDKERLKMRLRFEQLYWSDLPYIGEGPDVIEKMIKFREALISAETSEDGNSASWQTLNKAMILLANTLRNEDPLNNPECARATSTE